MLKDELPCTVWCKIFKTELFLKNNINWIEGINIGEDQIISLKALLYSKKTITFNSNGYHYRKNIGFSNYMKKKNIIFAKKNEYDYLSDYLIQIEKYDFFSDILDLKKAEIRYENIKTESVFSLKKYKEIYPEIKLNVLYKQRTDFNKTIVKQFINSIDNGHFMLANIFLLAYKFIGFLIRK